jgi:hypothetical protein
LILSLDFGLTGSSFLTCSLVLCFKVNHQ